MNQQIRKVSSNIKIQIGYINQHFRVLRKLNTGGYIVECIDNYGGIRERKKKVIFTEYLFENSTIISE